VLRRAAAVKKGAFVGLLFRAVTRAADCGLIGDRPEAAVDATGLESRHMSRYFFKRAGRKHTARLWTKLTVTCHTASHFFAAATVTAGPSNDAPQFRPAMCQAALAVDWDRVLADAAFDSEANHALCRDDLAVRSTVIPINRRGGGRKWPKTRYRRQMVRRFRKKPRGSRYRRVYGQRWQAESAFSRHKRRLGSALGGRSDESRERECYLRVLTHNLMLLAPTG
jgi:Transposase DDE domain